MSFHLTDTVHLNADSVDVSTIHLPAFGGYETCLFFANGDSEVVAWYGNVHDAAYGHKAWLNPSVLRYVKASVSVRQ